jgi:hypothetical protein
MNVEDKYLQVPPRARNIASAVASLGFISGEVYGSKINLFNSIIILIAFTALVFTGLSYKYMISGSNLRTRNIGSWEARYHGSSAEKEDKTHKLSKYLLIAIAIIYFANFISPVFYET